MRGYGSGFCDVLGRLSCLFDGAKHGTPGTVGEVKTWGVVPCFVAHLRDSRRGSIGGTLWANGGQFTE